MNSLVLVGILGVFLFGIIGILYLAKRDNLTLKGFFKDANEKINFWIKLTSGSIFIGFFSFVLTYGLTEIIRKIGQNNAKILINPKFISVNQDILNQLPTLGGCIFIGIFVAFITFYYGMKMKGKEMKK
jgi:hypothetical protein